MILSREDFHKAIDRLKRCDQFLDKLNDLLYEYKFDNQIYSTGLEDTVVDILEAIFDDQDTNWISHWVYECDFGESYKDGDVTENDGTIIPLKTVDDLYNLLIKNMER